MNGSHNEFVQLSKNKPTREHNVTLHHSLPITLRYFKERRKTMKSETASSHRATSNPQSTIHSSFHFHFISENHRQPHGQKKAAPLPTAPRRTSHYKTVRQSHTLHYKQCQCPVRLSVFFSSLRSVAQRGLLEKKSIITQRAYNTKEDKQNLKYYTKLTFS